MPEYIIEKFLCDRILDSSCEHPLRDGEIIKRGLLGNIIVKRYDSYDEFCEYFKNVSDNCRDIVKKNRCKRVLFIVFTEGMSESILEQYQKILMFDKELNLEPVSYEVLLVDKTTNIGYFGGMNEKGRTLLYKDTMKLLKR